MSSESRDLRPFDVDKALDRAFEKPRLRFGEQVCQPGSSILADRTTFGICEVRLEWAEEPDFAEFKRNLGNGAADTGLDRSLLSLLVVTGTSYLKIAEIVWCFSLAEISNLPRVVDLANRNRPRALGAATHGSTVSLYLVRNKQAAAPRLLHPWRKGTWLAQAHFKINTDRQAPLFRPVPLDDDKRKQLRLPKQTMRYIQLEDHDLLAPATDSIEPKFYVDKDLLAELDARGGSGMGKQIETQLFLDFATAVVFSVGPQLTDEAYNDLETSLAGQVVRLVAGPAESDRDNAISLIKTDPGKVIALVEDKLGIRRATLQNMRGDDQ